jgi:hypothetical protein
MAGCQGRAVTPELADAGCALVVWQHLPYVVELSVVI